MNLLGIDSSGVVHQLFFALRPPAPIGQHMAMLAQGVRTGLGVRQKPLTADRLHITLLDLGAYAPAPEALLAAACAAAAKVKLPPFELVLDRVDSFKNSHGNCPLVLRAAQGANPALTALQEALHLAALKLGLKSKRIVTPHVTLMYDSQSHAEQMIEPVTWTVREFELIDSLQGMHIHNVEGSWPLAG